MGCGTTIVTTIPEDLRQVERTLIKLPILLQR